MKSCRVREELCAVRRGEAGRGGRGVRGDAVW